jgi:glycosyltransferase involved in cell wall biosynthesis
MKVWYLSSGPFPTGSAYSTRLVGFARLLISLGHDVRIVVDDTPLSAREGVWDGIPYTALGVGGHSIVQRLTNRYRVSSFLQSRRNNGPDLVLLRSDADRFGRVSRQLQRQGVPYIVEICERYNPDNWRGAFLNPFYWQYQFAYRRQFPRARGLIAISRYLANQFSGISPRIVIPTIVDSTAYSWRREAGGKPVRLIYAGNPGRGKELLAEIVEAMDEVDPTHTLIRFDIYGVSGTRLQEIAPLSCRNPMVTAHGRRPVEEVLAAYLSADYGIFVRPHRISSQAGFPTKLAESMLCGTPSICNDTGDIGIYINEGNGVLLEGPTKADIARGLQHALSLSPKLAAETREGARRTAEQAFDYRSHQAAFSAFLDDVLAVSVEAGQPKSST